MTGRDRMVLLCLVAAVLLGAFYLKLVSPARKEAAKLTSEVSAANSQLSTAEGSLASARKAQSQYAAAYSSAVEIGKAVPPQAEVAALIFQIDAVSKSKDVAFNAISPGTGTSGAATSTPSSPSAAAGSASAASPDTFTPMPFTFNFEGQFAQLTHMFETIEGFTKKLSSGQLQVTGRLLTIQTLKLIAPQRSTLGAPTHKLTGTVTASAYVLPPSSGASASPSSSGSPSPTTTSSPATSSPTTPAVARVAP